MATFESEVEGLTGIDITTETEPNQTQLTEFLRDGIIEVVNRIITLVPGEIPKFTATTESTSSVTKKGKVLSVTREHNSTSILRQCTRIDSSLRYEATNIDSLHYRSKYNPAYYEMDNTIFCVPTPNDTANNDIVVSQINYDTGLNFSDTYNAGSIANFPLDYEYLVALNASLKVLLYKMSKMHADTNISTAFTAVTTALDRISLSIYSASDNYDLSKRRFKQLKKSFDNFFDLYNGQFPTVLSDVEYFIKGEDPEMLEKVTGVLQMHLQTAQQVMGEVGIMLDAPIKEAQGYIAEITSRMGNLSQEYSWYDSRYTKLKTEYDSAFVIMAPQKAPQRAR